MDYPETREAAEEAIREAGKQVWIIRRVRVGGSERNPIYDNAYSPAWAVELHQRLRNRDGSMAPGVVHQLMVSTEGIDFEITNAMSVGLVENATGPDVIAIAEVRPLKPGPMILLWEIDLNG